MGWTFPENFDLEDIISRVRKIFGESDKLRWYPAILEIMEKYYFNYGRYLRYYPLLLQYGALEEFLDYLRKKGIIRKQEGAEYYKLIEQITALLLLQDYLSQQLDAKSWNSGYVISMEPNAANDGFIILVKDGQILTGYCGNKKRHLQLVTKL